MQVIRGTRFFRKQLVKKGKREGRAVTNPKLVFFTRGGDDNKPLRTALKALGSRDARNYRRVRVYRFKYTRSNGVLRGDKLRDKFVKVDVVLPKRRGLEK